MDIRPNFGKKLKKNLGPMRAGIESTVESRILLILGVILDVILR